jgi:tRNA uridine 5-carboxymethylaminomethyl modification enzyme
LLAGINAARQVQGREPVILRRDQAYTGVLIDDIVTKEIREPYRILTARAEHRLLLRHDNADLRLTPLGHELGMVSDERLARVEEKRRRLLAELDRLESTSLPPSPQVIETMVRLGYDPPTRDMNLLQLLRRPEVHYELIASLCPGEETLEPDEIDAVETESKYEGYIARQANEVERLRRLEEWRIPPGFNYQGLTGLRAEAIEKLSRYQPLTIGQASRVEGVNPADVSVLLVHLTARRGREQGG